MTGPLRLGVVGAGAFAAFVAAAVRTLPDVRITAVADTDAARAGRLAHQVSARPLTDWRALVGGDDVDVVVVATPPATHAEIALAALGAGKHVFCEKPLATDEAEAAAVASAAQRSGRVLVVDHVLRYNPILRAIRRLADPLLGSVQRFAFENDASDENLGPDHWFWDERISGGILVEHGVHFFDAADALIGTVPDAVQAMVARRPGSDLIDLAVATVRYPGGVLATFAHGFTHADRCERQLMRIDFGAAEARVTGWIPVHAVIDVWTDDAGAAVAEDLPARAPKLLAVPGHRLAAAGRMDVAVERDAGPAHARARGRDLRLPHRARIVVDLGGEKAKKPVYAESIRAAMTDLVHCVRTGGVPAAGPTEGWRAVAVAAAARRAAQQGRDVDLAPLVAAGQAPRAPAPPDP